MNIDFYMVLSFVLSSRLKLYWLLVGDNRTTGHWMATGKAWGLASSLWEALLAWEAGGGPVEATAPTASTATY